MFAKLAVVLAVVGCATAGQFLRKTYAPEAYDAHVAPAVSTVSFSTNAAPIAYSKHAFGLPVHTGNVVSYAPAPPVQQLSYPAPPAQLSYSAPPAQLSYSTPLEAKTVVAAPAFSSYTAHPAPVATYAAAPVATQPYAAPALATYEPAPLLAKAFAPPVSSYSVEPVVAKTIVAPAAASPVYAAPPVLKSAVTYSSAPAVSRVTYKGLDTSYSW